MPWTRARTASWTWTNVLCGVLFFRVASFTVHTHRGGGHQARPREARVAAPGRAGAPGQCAVSCPPPVWSGHARVLEWMEGMAGDLGVKVYLHGQHSYMGYFKLLLKATLHSQLPADFCVPVEEFYTNAFHAFHTKQQVRPHGFLQRKIMCIFNFCSFYQPLAAWSTRG